MKSVRSWSEDQLNFNVLRINQLVTKNVQLHVSVAQWISALDFYCWSADGIQRFRVRIPAEMNVFSKVVIYGYAFF